MAVRVVLTTPRMVLREFVDLDLPDLAELHADPAVLRFITGGKPIPIGVVERETLPGIIAGYDRHPGFGTWAAHQLDSGAFLGWFALCPPDDGRRDDAELGYRLRSAAWNLGYATEGSRALVHHGFATLGLNRIHAETMAVNSASRRVMEKAGLRHVRTFHVDWDDPIPGTEHGEVEYALHRSEWESTRS